MFILKFTRLPGFYGRHDRKEYKTYSAAKRRLEKLYVNFCWYNTEWINENKFTLSNHPIKSMEIIEEK